MNDEKVDYFIGRTDKALDELKLHIDKRFTELSSEVKKLSDSKIFFVGMCAGVAGFTSYIFNLAMLWATAK